MSRVPRTGDEAFAERMGISVQSAAAVRRHFGGEFPAFETLDAKLRAEGALADLEAARLLDDDDVAEAALSDNPKAALEAAAEATSERILRARLAAHVSWANTEDRSARTRNARAGLEEKWLREAGGDPKRAESLRKAHYTRMALKSAQARRRKREAESQGP